MRKFYRYMGAKTKHIVFLNEIFKNSVSKNYCEPFLGSAIVFLNLEKEFDKYFLNDLQKYPQKKTKKHIVKHTAIFNHHACNSCRLESSYFKDFYSPASWLPSYKISIGVNSRTSCGIYL